MLSRMNHPGMVFPLYRESNRLRSEARSHDTQEDSAAPSRGTGGRSGSWCSLPPDRRAIPVSAPTVPIIKLVAIDLMTARGVDE